MNDTQKIRSAFLDKRLETSSPLHVLGMAVLVQVF